MFTFNHQPKESFSMNSYDHFARMGLLAGIAIFGSFALTQATAGAADEGASTPYKILKTVQVMGTGGIDYVYADNDERRLYIPRGNQVLVFDLNTLKSVGSITNARARGAAVDPKSHHGF